MLTTVAGMDTGRVAMLTNEKDKIFVTPATDLTSQNLKSVYGLRETMLTRKGIH